MSQKVYNWPEFTASISGGGPIQFIKNGSTVSVTQDTVTPANNIPLLVSQYDTSTGGTGSGSALNADLIPASNVTGYTHVIVQIVGTWVGTIQAQVSNDNFASTVYNAWIQSTTASYSPPGNQVTANGLYVIPLEAEFFRLRLSSYTSGTAQAYYWFEEGPWNTLNGGYVSAFLNTSNAVIGQVKVTDGTNGVVAVKPASTAAAATDPSHVVALSPNSPLPAGSNNIGTMTLPSGAATSALQTQISGQLPTTLGAKTSAQSLSMAMATDMSSNNPAPRSMMGLAVTPAQETLFKPSLSAAIASGVDTNYWTLVNASAGHTIAQTAGSIVINTNLTTNDELIIRSKVSVTGDYIARIHNILSQRIANNNFYFELVDVIGDGLSATASSATSLAVTIPSNPFTSANVGQFMFVGALGGSLVGGVPGRYAIASVAGNVVTFTVAGFPVASGTVSLFGWNYNQVLSNGTVATTSNYDTQRKGWNSGSTSNTTTTTASPGETIILTQDEQGCYLGDYSPASNAGNVVISRASRTINCPDESTPLYLQIRSLNGSTAPATNTTLTISTVSLENYAPQQVSINQVKGLYNNPLPVNVSTFGATISTVSSVTSGNLGVPQSVADATSGAITATTTTTPTAINTTIGQSYQINIPVTAVSGTSSTMDIEIQESADGGTNWYATYDFPRITAVGTYNSPVLPYTGNRIRMIQTLNGTTPSFTRAINRLQSNYPAPMFRQMIDRTIVLTTANSTTAVLITDGCDSFNVVTNALTMTTAPVLVLEGTDDQLSWFVMSSNIGITANASVITNVTGYMPKFVRVRVLTAGSAATYNTITIKGTKSGVGSTFAQAGRATSTQLYNVYSTTNVTTAAYVQLTAATTIATTAVEVFDSSGQFLLLGVGAAGSEVVQLNITPGGNGLIPLYIPAGSRIAVKALSANATTGTLNINLYS